MTRLSPNGQDRDPINVIRLRRIFVITVCCIFVTGLFNISLGQTNQQKPELKFQRIHEGLVSNTVSTIAQDSQGYIWVGTYSGLHRYDGINFHVYTSSEDTASISSNFIGEIYVDENSKLWIGTGNGVSRYNRSSDNFTRFTLPGRSTSDSETNIINTIFEDENGNLWAAGNGEQLYYFDNQENRFILHRAFAGLTINDVKPEDDNIFWIATLNVGLIKYNTASDKVEESFAHDPSDSLSIASDAIDELARDADENLWIGTRDSGLDRMIVNNDETTFRHYRHEPGNPSSLRNNAIFSLYIDASGSLWVGNENGGLHLYNKKTDSFFHYDSDPNDPYSLSHNSIWAMFEDREGRYWVGTGLSGLNVVDSYSSKFTHYQNFHLANSLNNNIIREFQESDEGNIWIATDGGGLNYFDRSKGIFTAITHNPEDTNSLRSDAVLDISKDNEGRLWVGTWGGGVNILTDPQQGHFITFKEKINNYTYPIKNVLDTHFDRENDYIWIAGFGEGLYRYDKKRDDLQVFTADSENAKSLASRYILRIFEDSDSNLWITTIEGLSLLKSQNKEKGIFDNFFANNEDATSLPSNTIQQVIEDSGKNIWIATSGGLAKFVREYENFITYKKSDGLPSDDIKSIVEDDKGYLWVGTINGLSQFDPVEKKFENYHESDGLQGNEFSRYSAYKLSSGELLFGGMNGFNIFHPDSVKDNPNPPPVYITDFKLFNKSVAIGEEDSPLDKHISVTDTLVLSHNHNVFTFDFVALNYTNATQNQYAFKMDGFEEEWNYVGNRRNATYTNLNPGEYIFRVKASNNDDTWNEKGTSVVLFITPPFWQTSWFYLLFGLFILGIAITAYRWRMKNIKAYSKRLEKEVSDRTSELNSKNKDLENALQQLEEARDELVQKAHKAGMAELATGVLHNVGNILTSVNTSASLIGDTIKQSRIKRLTEANTILREHIDRLEEFISDNPKAKKLMQYYLKLEEPLRKEQSKILQQSQRLIDKIGLINEVIAAQQSYASAGMHADRISLSDVIDNALALQSGSIEKHGLTVEKSIQDVDPVIVQRTKLIHVLVNIFKNAKESMAGNPAKEKKISIKVWQDDCYIYLSVTDNGSGISRKYLDRIFTHGFTTKKSGHGFGLHSSANYMTEMGGKIKASSKGKGEGATFTLFFPRKDTEQDKKN